MHPISPSNCAFTRASAGSAQGPCNPNGSRVHHGQNSADLSNRENSHSTCSSSLSRKLCTIWLCENTRTAQQSFSRSRSWAKSPALRLSAKRSRSQIKSQVSLTLELHSEKTKKSTKTILVETLPKPNRKHKRHHSYGKIIKSLYRATCREPCCSLPTFHTLYIPFFCRLFLLIRLEN